MPLSVSVTVVPRPEPAKAADPFGLSGATSADLYVDQATSLPTKSSSGRPFEVRSKRASGLLPKHSPSKSTQLAGTRARLGNEDRGVIRSLRLRTDGHLSRGGLRPPRPIKRVLQWHRQPHRVGSSGPRPGQVRRSQPTSKRSNRLQNTETAPRGRPLYSGLQEIGSDHKSSPLLGSFLHSLLASSAPDGNSPECLHAES
jgi:hypothetical protein